MRNLIAISALALVSLAPPLAGPWEGEWVTDQGLMSLAQKGDEITGRYGDGGEIKGKAEGRKLSGTWSRGKGSGDFAFELGADGFSFKGTWKGGGDSGSWRGWKKDPDSEKLKPGDFSGFWLSSWGSVTLEQKGKTVKGKYGAQGWGTLEGEVRGRRLAIKWKWNDFSGTAWIDLTRDGKRFFGMSEGEGAEKWLGLRLTGFEPNVRPKAGDIVEGRAENGMLYFLRMPKSWKPGAPVDVIVLLHGSNWTTKGMVFVTAKAHPPISDRFAILGIQGERWADWSDADDLRFNYSYVNWMGRSTYKGYPNTDRESPYLVSQVVDELKKKFDFGRVFVGGHSQGGFLTYLLHMHYPEKWAGTFPIAGNLVIQAEPDVFQNAELLKAQRSIPMAIVQGTRDEVIRFSTGRYCYDRFVSEGFPLLRLFAPEVGHAFDHVPIRPIIEWLDVMSSPDVAALADYAKKRAAAGEWRDVAAALVRAKALKAEGALEDAKKLLNEAASELAAKHLESIRKNKDGSWVLDFLGWHHYFEFAPATREVVLAYEALQKEHNPIAEQLMDKARQAFQAGNRDEGWARYQEIVDKYYAAKKYQVVWRWLRDRK